MFDFIPLKYYEVIYYNLILIIVFVAILHSISNSGFTQNTSSFNKKLGYFLLLFLLIYQGLRPISYHFVDMGRYAEYFNDFVNGKYYLSKKDIGFYTLMKLLAYFKSSTLFFFIIDVLYIVPLYIASKRWFPKYYFFAFLILVASFSFWSYGTNGLRNGVATSLMLLALSYDDKPKIRYLLFLLAYSFHSSMLLVISAYFLTKIIMKTSYYFIFWLLSIFMSLAMGSFWEGFFIKLGFGQEDKLQTYFSAKELYADSFAYTGFRWDFLIYSSTAVIIAFYFIYIKRFKDKNYNRLVNIYLITNAFWILVIRASFSNRFAYLSWFMMGIVIIYPLLKKVYWKNQFSIIGLTILLYYTFTYFMNVIL